MQRAIEMKKSLLWRIIDCIIFINITGMVVVICLQVISRMINQSVCWSEELTRNFFIWTVNFGMAYGFRKVEHARVTFIFDLLPSTKLFKNIQGIIYLLSCITFFVVVAYLNYGMTYRQYLSCEMSPALGIPMFYVTLPLMICSILSIVALIQSYFFDPIANKMIKGNILSGVIEEFNR